MPFWDSSHGSLAGSHEQSGSQSGSGHSSAAHSLSQQGLSGTGEKSLPAELQVVLKRLRQDRDRNHSTLVQLEDVQAGLRYAELHWRWHS
jgi:hypothetical protein